jgi:hypothetical protein
VGVVHFVALGIPPIYPAMGNDWITTDNMKITHFVTVQLKFKK